jgi:hypothetical protein
MPNLNLTSGHQEALKNFEVIKDALAKHQEEKERLIFQEKPFLESLYLNNVGKLKIELLELKTEVYALKRKSEMIQSSINQSKDVLIEVIDVLLKKEMEEHLQKLHAQAKRLQEAKEFLASPSMAAEDVLKVRNLYHKLVKKLHPDLIGEQTETQKVLWNRISEAYRAYDLELLTFLELLSEQENEPDIAQKKSSEELEEKIQAISKYIKILLVEIEKIKENFPFTIKTDLEDQNWIELENNRTLDEISRTLEEKGFYKLKIKTLLNE